MLGVSLRLPENADIGGALLKYIASNYTPEEVKNSARGIAEVTALRAQMVQSVGRNASEQNHRATLDVFTTYYRTLTCLVSRFPFQSASRPLVAEAGPSSLLGKISALGQTSKVRQVSLLTTWFDAFRHSNRVQDYDVAFERLSVMFDIAALYSRHATQLKGTVPVGGGDPSSAAANSSLKESCRLFQLSSGIFDHMSRTPEIVTGALGNSMSIDLTSDALSMLAVLMLAQAQACFFEAATGTASPKLVAKLAMGVATLFRDAHQRCEKNARLKAIFGKHDVYPWSQHCLYQSLCYQAASNYWFAKGALAEDEYGVEIAHLERARSILQQARPREVNLLKNLGDNRARLEAAIVARLQAAHKDNETIYYSAIPKPDQIRDPESVHAVKMLPIESADTLTVDAAQDDKFNHLISPHLRQQVDTLRAKVSEVQAELAKRVTQAEQTGKTVLEQLGLPASLDALADSSGKGGIPDDVWNKIQEIQYKGGAAQLQGLNSRIEGAVSDTRQAFDEIAAQLTKEKEQDTAMRTQFAHRWNRRPSEQLTVHLQKDADSVRRFLRDADGSNAKVRGELEQCRMRFELLSLTREELEAKLPRATAEQSQGSQQSVVTLRQLIAQLGENTQKLQRLVPDFEAKLQSTDFMSQVVSSSAGHGAAGSSAAGAGGEPDAATTEANLQTALLPFKQFHSAFDESVAAQSTLLSQIGEANKQFLSLRSSDDSTQRRQAYLHDLNVSVASYNKLLANLNEGLRFYADLTRTKIAPLAQKVNDYCMARNMEATLILEQLSRASSGFKEDAQPAQPAQPPAASPGNPFADASPAPRSGQAGASNPNLSYEQNNLYSMNSPPPGAHSPPSQSQSSFAPGGHHGQPQHHQPPPQIPVAQPVVPPRPHVYGVPTPQQQQQQFQSHGYQQQPQQQPPPQQQYHPQPPQYQQPPHSYASAPPPAAAPKQPEWECAACTFLNPLSAQACNMCGGKR